MQVADNGFEVHLNSWSGIPLGGYGNTPLDRYHKESVLCFGETL